MGPIGMNIATHSLCLSHARSSASGVNPNIAALSAGRGRRPAIRELRIRENANVVSFCQNIVRKKAKHSSNLASLWKGDKGGAGEVCLPPARGGQESAGQSAASSGPGRGSS